VLVGVSRLDADQQPPSPLAHLSGLYTWQGEGLGERLSFKKKRPAGLFFMYKKSSYN